jgi:hypothetical protein
VDAASRSSLEAAPTPFAGEGRWSTDAPPPSVQVCDLCYSFAIAALVSNARAPAVVRCALKYISTALTPGKGQGKLPPFRLMVNVWGTADPTRF